MEFIQTIGKLIVRYHSFFEEGIVNTLIIAAFTVFFGTIFGTLMSSMRMSKILPLKWLAVAYIEFIRGTPLMVQLMFIFYGLPMVGFTLPDISWIPNFSRFSAGIIAMSINSCAYVAEIIRAGIPLLYFLAFITYAQTSQVVFSGCLRGAGDTKFVAAVSFVSILFLRPLLSYVLCYPLQFGLIGAWVGVTIDQFARLIATLWRFGSGKWTKIRV